MRLLDVNTPDKTGGPRMIEFIGNNIPEYAILSHTWGDDEVLFSDIVNGTARQRKACLKLAHTLDKAKNAGYDWVWIDTCCIDKSSSAELQESINSMYKWYERCGVCFAYLEDVEALPSSENWETELTNSRWITRGWTLQELLAPGLVIFFSKEWQELSRIHRRWGSRPHISYGSGSLFDELVSYPASQKVGFERLISRATGIEERYLVLPTRRGIQHVNVATRMGWASGRATTREEDKAYSLLGLFEVNMPLLYGEGENAFIRFQEEIIRRSDDMSIFYWKLSGFDVRMRNIDDEITKLIDFRDPDTTGMQSDITGLLAPGPQHFAASSTAEAVSIQRRSLSAPFEMTNKGLRAKMPLIRIGNNLFFSLLDCNDRDSSFSTQEKPQPSERSSSSTVGVCLRRAYNGGNQFYRAYPDRVICIKDIGGLLETIFVRQTIGGQSLPSDGSELFETPLLLSSIRVYGDQALRRNWNLTGIWERHRSCKWVHTFDCAKDVSLEEQTAHPLRSGGWENGILNKFSVQERVQAVAINIEHHKSPRRFALVFRKANHTDFFPMEDRFPGRELGTRLCIFAFVLPAEGLPRDPFEIDVDLVKYEASPNDMRESKPGQGITSSAQQDILLCYTLELSIGWWYKSPFPGRDTDEQCYAKIPFEREKLLEMFENAFKESNEAKCIAPWSGASFTKLYQS